jgi:hypothetical protein
MPIILPKCPDKYELNKTKCRCKKIKNMSVKKKTKKKTKKNTKKRCPKGTRKNKKTGECEKVLVLLDTTPKAMKELRYMVKKMGKKKYPKQPESFSPNVNQIISSLKSISPHKELGFAMCHDDQVYIKKDTHKGRCYGLKSKIAQTYMIDNLLSKKPVDCNAIIAPKQLQGNCWFNAFFMVYFISDKGRKFFRYLRLAMITGKLPNGTQISSKLRMPLLIMNKYIEASLLGVPPDADPRVSLATLMDTNQIIRKIARNLGKAKRIELNIVKTEEASNPFSFYNGLITYLKSNPLSFTKIVVRGANSKHRLVSDIQNLLNNERNSLDFFILERWSEDFPIKSWSIPKKFKINYKGEEHTYILDSAVLRDTQKKHFSAYITCNGKPFGFDGEGFARITPFDWKKKMNKDTKWRFADQYKTYFNFQKGYYMLFYYRI